MASLTTPLRTIRLAASSFAHTRSAFPSSLASSAPSRLALAPFLRRSTPPARLSSSPAQAMASAHKSTTEHEWETKAEGALQGLVLQEDQSHDPTRAVKGAILQLVPEPRAGQETHCVARFRLDVNTEKQLNNMINVEYSLSYSFHAMSNYFGRDCVALPGLAALFMHRSTETRGNAITLSDYVKKRGGCVLLKSIPAPEGEFNNEERGDALHGMELCLAMEKDETEKFMALNKAAEDVVDEQLSDYITDTFLDKQMDLLQQHAYYVSQLRRVGKGHGHWDWDRTLAIKMEVSEHGLV